MIGREGADVKRGGNGARAGSLGGDAGRMISRSGPVGQAMRALLAPGDQARE